MIRKNPQIESRTGDGGISENAPPRWHAQPFDDVLSQLGAARAGLSAEQAAERLAQFGPNRLTERRRMSAWMRLLLQFHNPLIYVLLVTAVVTGLLAHWVDTGVILAVVVINALIGFVQEAKAEKAIESLRNMLAPLAVALRDGRRVSIPATELVPGDIVFLQGGDKVPADLRLGQEKNLRIDESALTGESEPQDKALDLLRPEAGLADRRNMAFAGTLVASGAGMGVITSTGQETELGHIADMLHEVVQVETPLIRRLTEFSKMITLVIIGFCVLVFGLGILTGVEAVEMLMAAVALAVSAIPEGLPAIMTITLAIGVKRMAASRAVIRKLPAVEVLGSATMICTDKTGTLTRNEMTVTSVVTPTGEYAVDGVGYAPTGDITPAAGGESLGEVGAADAMASPEFVHLLQAAALCNDSDLIHAEDSWKISGDPTEAALLVLAAKGGLDLDELRRSLPRTDAIPFESDQQYMATLHHDHEGHGLIFLKGSPERVFALCDREAGTGKPVDVEAWLAHVQLLASQGRRVLAVARRSTSAEHTVLEFNDVASGLELLGLVGMIDPPRAEAVEAVAHCHAAGIHVTMITGDHLATARAVGAQVGLPAERALTGAEIDQLSEEEFDRAAAEVRIFARVSPAHKLRLVQALQRQGHVVAMTGDGVNDAPALKQADIGVAMGINGTEVSKEAAEMVILDDNFATIARAVEQGRAVYDNLTKTILFILPTNGGECLTLVAALFLGATLPFLEVTLPILPLHILWINLITAVTLAIALAFDPVEDDVMQRPPRKADAPLINRLLLWRIAYVSLLMAIGTFGLFKYELLNGATEAMARAVAVNAIVFFEVFYLFNSRHLVHSTLNLSGLFGNRIGLWAVLTVVVLQLLFTYWPPAYGIFKVEPISLMAWARVLGAGVLLFLLVEGEKWLIRRWGKHRAPRPMAG